MSRGVSYSLINANSERAQRSLRQLNRLHRYNAQRQPQGYGAIAIIHTATQRATSELPPTFKITFFNVADFDTGCAIFESGSEAASRILSQSTLVIHRDGDLRLSGLPSSSDTHLPLLEFAISDQALRLPLELQHTGAHGFMVPLPLLEFALPRSDVPGDLGVVGRRISIIDDGMRLIGDGVVGWC